MSIIKANSASFEQEVLKSDRPVLLDFSAEWCGPCKALEPTLEKIAGAREDIKIVKVDVDESKDIAEKYNVRSMPTLMIVNKGKVVSNFSGQRTESNLNTWIDENKDNTEKKDFKAEFNLKAIADQEEFKELERKSNSIGRRLYGAMFPAAVSVGGVALAVAATGPFGAILGVGAAVAGAHSIIKQQQVRGSVKDMMNAIKSDDKKSLEDKAKDFVLNFNPYSFFGRNMVKGGVTAAAGVALVGATSGVGFAVLGVGMALYGGAGALVSTAGMAGSYFGLKWLDKKLDEAEADDKAKDGEGAVKPKAEPAPTVAGPKPAASFNPAANQNTPEAGAAKDAPAVKKADKKAKPGA